MTLPFTWFFTSGHSFSVWNYGLYCQVCPFSAAEWWCHTFESKAGFLKGSAPPPLKISPIDYILKYAITSILSSKYTSMFRNPNTRQPTGSLQHLSVQPGTTEDMAPPTDILKIKIIKIKISDASVLDEFIQWLVWHNIPVSLFLCILCTSEVCVCVCVWNQPLLTLQKCSWHNVYLLQLSLRISVLFMITQAAERKLLWLRRTQCVCDDCRYMFSLLHLWLTDSE